MLTELLTASFLLGIAYCAPLGPVNAETIRRGLAHGFRPALAVQLGSILGDMVWALMALAGGALLVENPVAHILLSGLGITCLVWLAWSALVNVRQGDMPELGKGHITSDFWVGALMSLGSPFAFAFWLGLSVSTMSSLMAQPTPRDYAAFLIAFLVSVILFAFAAAAAASWGRRYITLRLFRGINLACAAVLLYYAGRLGWAFVWGLNG